MGLVSEAPGYITSGLAIFSFVALWLMVEIFIYFGKRHQRYHRPSIPTKNVRKYDDQDQA